MELEGEGGEAEDEVRAVPAQLSFSVLRPDAVVPQELEAMKTRVKEMEDEAEQLRKIQEQVEEQMTGAHALCSADRPRPGVC